MLSRARVWLRPISLALVAASLLAGVLQEAAVADSAPTSATVIINERGFNPPNAFIQKGGTVTWTNTGTESHDVATGSAPLSFELGLSPGQSVTWQFAKSGIYHYTALTDCAPSVLKTLFPCMDYSVVVLDPDQPMPTPVVQPTPTPQPKTIMVQQDATPQITDSGFVPVIFAITAGGTATWTNFGVQVHTATSTIIPTISPWDTGALPTAGAGRITLTDLGLYQYTSETDCLYGNNQPTFDCRPAYIIVTADPPGTTLPVPDFALRSPTTTAGPPTVPPASNTVITVDDSHGFQPRNLTVKLGQIVTFMNKGQKVHSVVTDSGITASFDSGGIGADQFFTWIPPGPGTYRYHSTTDPLNLLDPACKCSLYGGTVIVGQ